jgi:cytochrome c
MDSFELNKIMGAVLGTLLFVMGAGFVAEAIYHPKAEGPGYNLPEPEIVAENGEGVAAEPEVPLGVLLANADPARGEQAVRKCQSCHNFGEGEPNKQGPHLYGVVGRPEGSVPDFAYSDGMMAHNAAGDVWTYENLNHFLTKPSDYVPGTKMNFAGVRTAEERADILAYLQTLAADPVPFPPPEEAAAPPAEGNAEEVGSEPAANEEAQPADPSLPTDPAATAPENETEPVAPASAVEGPEETQSETPVIGTPTTSGTPATTEVPTSDQEPNQLAPAPQTPNDPAAPAPAQSQ